MNTYILRYIACEDEGGGVYPGYKKLDSEKTKKDLITEFNTFIDQSLTNKKRYLNYYGVEVDLVLEGYIDIEYKRSKESFDSSFDPFSDEPQDTNHEKLVNFLKYMSEETSNILPDSDYPDYPDYFDASFKILTLDEFLESIK